MARPVVERLVQLAPASGQALARPVAKWLARLAPELEQVWSWRPVALAPAVLRRASRMLPGLGYDQPVLAGALQLQSGPD